MKRYYLKFLEEYLDRKIALITGPRQCGKTTVSKMIEPNYQYLNFDDEDARGVIAERSWDRKKKLIIFDELHKKPKWKAWLKGIFDSEGVDPKLVVTGSARMDTYLKVGDSLAGRYFQYRLHPFDVRELFVLKYSGTPRQWVERMLLVGGFPEPFLEGTERFHHIWKKTHLDIILRQDLIYQEDVKNIKMFELLLDLLKTRVGSPISYSSLAEDLQCSDKSVKRWLSILEEMYVVFKVLPYHKNMGRSVLKRPKYYFYDVARVKGDIGAKLENLVACSLLKECHFRQDCQGEEWDLFYLAKKGGVEIDFGLAHDGKLKQMIEVKTSDDTPTKNFRSFASDLSDAKKVQLVFDLKNEKTYPDGTEIRDLSTWLCSW